MPVQAVIFDLDGVLIDTEPQLFAIWQEIVRPYGLTLDETDFHTMVGITVEATEGYLVAKSGGRIPLDDLVAENNRRVEAYLSGGLAAQPGAVALLDDLTRRALPLAVASNSPTGYVRDVLKTIRLSHFFQAVVTRDQVDAGKPAPDIYLAAAAQLDADPRTCLAVEDSAVGIQAALAAGMCCAAIRREGLPPDIKPQACFKSLVELHQALPDLLFRPGCA